MKQRKNAAAVLFCLFVVLLASSCNKNKLEQTKHIPKDATFVLCINPLSIYDKIKANKAQVDSVMNLFFDKIKATDSKELVSEALDLQKPFFFFAKTTSSIAEGNSFSSAIIASVKDAGKFKELIQKDSSYGTIGQGNGFTFSVSDRSIVGWDNKIAVYIPSIAPVDSLGKKAALESLFNMKESESIADNKQFTKSFTTNADISYYSNSSQSLSSIPFLAMSKASDLVKDLYSAGTINFNAGSIDVLATSYPNAALLDLIKKNPSSKISENTLANYNGKPDGIIDISFNMKQLVSVIDFMGVDQMINPFLQKQGISLDDIASAFKGEFAFAVSDFGIKQTTLPGYNISTNSPTANFLFCAPIADKKSYDKLINALAQVSPDMFVNKNGQAVPAFIAQSSTGTAFSVDDKNLLLASSQGLLDSFTTGKGHISLPDDVSKNMKGKTSYFYGNIQNVLSSVPAEGSDSALIVLSKNTFKDISAWGNDMNGNSFTGELHLRFQDAAQNSLITLLNYGKQLKIASDNYQSKIISDTASEDDLNTNIAVPPGVDTSAK